MACLSAVELLAMDVCLQRIQQRCDTLQDILRWVKTGSEHSIRDTEVHVYEEIATVCGSGIQFTEIKWLPCVSFLALLSVILAVSYYCIVLCY